jgi:hypothetical protein
MNVDADLIGELPRAESALSPPLDAFLPDFSVLVSHAA